MGDHDLWVRGVRLRSLAGNEGEWTKFLDVNPDSPEAFMDNIPASMAAYVASQGRQSISRRTTRDWTPPGRSGQTRKTRWPGSRARDPSPCLAPWVGPHPAHRRIPVAKAPISDSTV